MSGLDEHIAVITSDEHASLVEQTLIRRRRSARIRRARVVIASALCVLSVGVWLAHAVQIDSYRTRVNNDQAGVRWVLDTVESAGDTAAAPSVPQYWLELSFGGAAATSSADGCSAASATWTATSNGFSFASEGDNAVACRRNGIAPAVDPLIVNAQQRLISGASVTAKTAGNHLTLLYSIYRVSYHSTR